MIHTGSHQVEVFVEYKSGLELQAQQLRNKSKPIRNSVKVLYIFMALLVYT